MPKPNLILGIESSCDETAAALVDTQLRVRASTVSSQIELHRVTHGVVPEVAARAHTERILPVIDECLRRARATPAQLAGVAVTRGPGLITSLLVGLETAKALAFGWDVPLIGVNHIEGHVLSSLLDEDSRRRLVKATRGSATAAAKLSIDKRRLPIVVLTVSGGHTELMLLRELGDYQLLGRTRDDAAGEAFDKVARLLDLPYPGGPSISKAAERGNPTRYPFPRPMLTHPGFDFSFAGLKTDVRRTVERLPMRSRARWLPDVAASFQKAVVDTLLGKAGRAVDELHARELWIVGGVAANALLRSEAAEVAASKGITLRIPSFAFCTDNAVMVAAVGAVRLGSGKKNVGKNVGDNLVTLRAEPALDLALA